MTNIPSSTSISSLSASNRNETKVFVAKQVEIERASRGDSKYVAEMVGELLNEIMGTVGVKAFNFSLDETASRLGDFLDCDKYFVFVASDKEEGPIGFATLYESYALYAEGAFGTIAEFYVRPAFRSSGVGGRLLAHVKAFGASRGWTRLEVTTPPLPQFDKTLAFYEREGFAITGGRKLKTSL